MSSKTRRLFTDNALFRFICKVKVLILHQHFNTPQKGGALRSYYLAKALVDAGIHTTVITGRPLPTEKIEMVEGITVHYLPNPYDNRFGFYKRSISFLRYIAQSVRAARHYRDADVCYAISTPLTIGLAARWIRMRYNIPYIFEVGDLWPDAPVQLGVVQSPFLKGILYRLEKSIYQQAKAIVALSPSIADAIRKRVTGKDIHIIPNMADTSFFQKEKKNKALEEKFGVTDKLVVSYIGALGVANGLDYFLECVRASEKASLPIHFILCGDGGRLDHLREMARRRALQTLTFIDFQNRAGVYEILNITDAVLISYKPVPVLETGSPNKYFDGLAAGKLVVVNFGGWIKEEITQRQCGIFVDPKQPADFVEKIAPYLNDKGLLERSQLAARALAEEQYAREILSKKFAAIFRAI